MNDKTIKMIMWAMFFAGLSLGISLMRIVYIICEKKS